MHDARSDNPFVGYTRGQFDAMLAQIPDDCLVDALIFCRACVRQRTLGDSSGDDDPPLPDLRIL